MRRDYQVDYERRLGQIGADQVGCESEFSSGPVVESALLRCPETLGRLDGVS